MSHEILHVVLCFVLKSAAKVPLKSQANVKGAGSRNVNKLLSNDNLAVFLIGHNTVIFHYFSQNESVVLEMDSCTSQRNKLNT